MVLWPHVRATFQKNPQGRLPGNFQGIIEKKCSSVIPNKNWTYQRTFRVHTIHPGQNPCERHRVLNVHRDTKNAESVKLRNLTRVRAIRVRAIRVRAIRVRAIRVPGTRVPATKITTSKICSWCQLYRFLFTINCSSESKKIAKFCKNLPIWDSISSRETFF